MVRDVSSIIFIVGIAGVLVLHFHAVRYFREQRALILKYRYFALRDEFVFLVAAGQINEDDAIFRQFYGAANFLVNRHKSLDFDKFVESMKEASEKGIDPAEDELPKRNSEVQKAVAHFFQAVIETIVENSFLIRLTIKYPRFLRLALAARRWVNEVPSVIKVYKRYETAMSQNELLNAA
jgi:hypothetical protein